MSIQSVEQETVDIISKAMPAVVSIVMSKFGPVSAHNPFHHPEGTANEFGIQLPEEEVGQEQTLLGPKSLHREKVKVGGGSGFIVSKDGHILTNKHVVFDSDAEYTVITNDGKELLGKVVSRDPINDVAILKVNTKNLPTIPLGDSRKVVIGQTAIAIGNALGMFSNSVSKGIVSGLGRKISAALGEDGLVEHLRNVIQSDVAINQGNSGGPLINIKGEVIGINTAIIYGAQNIGFSIPINAAHRDLNDIMKNGRIIKPYLGIRYITLSPLFQRQYGLPSDYGAIVSRDHIPGSEAIIKGSPAYKAGIKENDIILTINDKKIDEDHDIMDVIENSEINDILKCTILRDNKHLNIDIKLEERK